MPQPCNVIYILYSQLNRRLEVPVFEKIFNQLHPISQVKIKRFRKWEDAQRSLTGMHLLDQGLKHFEESLTLKDLKFTTLHKPYFESSIDFNIAHSGDFVVCAISGAHRVGIDIEEVRPIPLSGFDQEFSIQEWQVILNSPNSLQSFYTLWTKKEAFLKATGKGLHVPLNKVEISDNRISWNNCTWFFHKIGIHANYLTHLATNAENPQLHLQAVNIS